MHICGERGGVCACGRAFGDETTGGKGEPRDVRKEKIREVARARGKALCQRGGVGGIRLVLRFGQGVLYAGKEHALEIFLQRGDLERARHRSVLRENEIGVFAHDLGVQRPFGAGKFPRAVEGEGENALKFHLFYVGERRAREVLSEKHAKIRRDLGRGARRGRDARARKGSVRVENEFLRLPARI